GREPPIASIHAMPECPRRQGAWCRLHSLSARTPDASRATGRGGHLEATPSLPNRRPARLGALALIAVVAVLAPLLIARHYGALGIPRGDDWSYLLTLFRLSDSGQLNGNNWVSMTLLGQLVIALPVVGIFGHDIAALQVLTAVVGFCGLVATVVLGRRLIGIWPAVLVALTLGAG